MGVEVTSVDSVVKMTRLDNREARHVVLLFNRFGLLLLRLRGLGIGISRSIIVFIIVTILIYLRLFITLSDYRFSHLPFTN